MNDDVMLDARIRRGLQALPLPDQPRTSVALAEVTGSGRPPTRAPGRAVLVAAAVAACAVLAPYAVRTVAGDDEAEPAHSPRHDLLGSWSRVSEVPAEPTWDGRWMVTFGDAGVLGIEAPGGALRVSDAASYAVTGAQVRVDAFVNSICYELPPGSYSWVAVGDGIRLTPLDDDCAARAEMLTGTWRAAR